MNTDIEDQSIQKQPMSRKNLWFILGGGLATVLIICFVIFMKMRGSTDTQGPMKTVMTSQESTKITLIPTTVEPKSGVDPTSPVSESPEPAIPATKISPDLGTTSPVSENLSDVDPTRPDREIPSDVEPTSQVTEPFNQRQMDFVRNLLNNNTDYFLLSDLFKRSDAEIFEIVALAQNQVESTEEKLKIKMQMAADCFAVDKMECFDTLEIELCDDEKYSNDLAIIFTEMQVCSLFELPYARIGEAQIEFLKYVDLDGLKTFDLLAKAIAHLNSGQLKYLIKYIKDNKANPNINYNKIPNIVIQNYPFLPTFEDEIKIAVQLIKGIEHNHMQRVLGKLDTLISAFESGTSALSPDQIAGLKTYKYALNKYWDLDADTE